jgi:alkylation response protein AidB-like acyl-CoA dehydrogenase
MAQSGLTDMVRERKDRMKAFINERAIPAEPALFQDSDEFKSTMAGLTQAAKDEGLWALRHHAEIGGGGLGFLALTGWSRS